MQRRTFFNVSSRDRGIASLIFGFLLACYLLTYTGVIQSSDGLAMFATTESIVRRGEVDMNQLLWMDLQQGSYGPDGELYSRKGLGMTLLALPLVWLARLWPLIGLTQAALLLNPLLTAWTGGLLYRTGRRLKWTRTVSIATALVYGLATLAWPYTQTFFSDPMSAWGLFAAFYGLLGFRQTGLKRYLFAGGMAWGLAYLSRAINLISLPLFLFLLVVIIQRSLHVGWRTRPLFTLRRLVVRNWRAFASFCIPVIIAGLLSLWWNWLRYGNIWESGYIETESFSANLLTGVFGLLIGPARGLIWYSPILVLALIGAWWFWRNRPWILGFVIALTVLYTLVYGKWYMWHGGFSWGPRFMVVLLPFLALLTGPVFIWIATRRTGASKWIAAMVVALLFFLSVAVQWLGMLAPFSLVQNWLADAVQPLFAPETFTQLAYSPLLLQWRFLGLDTVPFAWWSGSVSASGVYVSVSNSGLLLPFVGIAVGGWLIGREIRSSHSTNSKSTGNTRLYWFYSAALFVIALDLLTTKQLTLNEGINREKATVIEASERVDDGILFLRPEETQAFANAYHGRLPTYGLTSNSEFSAADQLLLERLMAQYSRLWVIPQQELPEAEGWERTLRSEQFLLLEERVTDPFGLEDPERLSLYVLEPEEGALSTSGLGALFAEDTEGADAQDASEEIREADAQIRLNRYEMTTETVAGGDLLLVLYWESLQPVDFDYHVFVHLLDAAGNKVAQRDGQPVQWMRPTSTWSVGEEVVDRYALVLPKDSTAGTYTVAVGLYDPASGRRLKVNAGADNASVLLGPLVVN